MSDDPFSWLRAVGRGNPKPGSDTAATSAPAAAVVLPDPNGGQAYRAWGHGHPESSMIDVRTRSYQGEAIRGELLPLHYLMRVTYSCGALVDHVTLHFADCLVTVSGRNLAPMRDELMGGKVGFIEEHDPVRWGPFIGSGPVVEKIEIIAPGRQSGRA